MLGNELDDLRSHVPRTRYCVTHPCLDGFMGILVCVIGRVSTCFHPIPLPLLRSHVPKTTYCVTHPCLDGFIPILVCVCYCNAVPSAWAQPQICVAIFSLKGVRKILGRQESESLRNMPLCYAP